MQLLCPHKRYSLKHISIAVLKMLLRHYYAIHKSIKCHKQRRIQNVGMGGGRVEGGVWGKIWEIKQKIMHFLCKIFTIFEMHPVNKGAGALTPPWIRHWSHKLYRSLKIYVQQHKLQRITKYRSRTCNHHSDFVGQHISGDTSEGISHTEPSVRDPCVDGPCGLVARPGRTYDKCPVWLSLLVFHRAQRHPGLLPLHCAPRCQHQAPPLLLGRRPTGSR